MTNKINGIDVSECKYFNKVLNEEPYCNIEEEHLYTCSSDENCYFKQLKRLQEENEKLKNRLKTLDEEEFVYEVTEIEYNNFKKMNKYKQALEEIRSYCDEQNLKADYTACFITNRIDEVLSE